MANLNPIQINQPSKGLNSNQAISADSQESFVDQSFTSFPDELEAAKGQSQNPSASADSSEQKPEVVETVDLQNLPVTAAIGIVNPANIAAAIQVMAPVDTAAIEVINLDQLQLATLNTSLTVASEQLVSDALPSVDTAVDAQLIAQSLVTPESLAAASQHIQETVTGDKPVVTNQENLTSVIKAADQSFVTEASEVVVSTVNAQQNTVALATDNNAQSSDSDKLNQLAADNAQAKVLVDATIAVNPQVAAVVTGQNSEISVSRAGDVVASVSLDSTKLTKVISSEQLPTSQQMTAVNADSVDQSLANSQPVKLDGVEALQSAAQNNVAKDTAVNADIEVKVVADTVKINVSSDSAPELKAVVSATSNLNSEINVASEVITQVAEPVLEQLTKVVAPDAKQATPVMSAQNAPEKVLATNSQVTGVSSLAEDANPQASVVDDAQQIQVNRDDLAQSEDILAMRAENAKLAKSDLAAVQVDQLSTVEIKDLNKLDASNNGIIATDSNRSTFVANANQELKLAQAAPVKLEPHHVSLASGPLNIEVMRVLKEGGGRVIMEVTPPDQGTLQIDLRLDNQGKAILIVDGASDSTRARLEQGSAELRQQLADMGLQLSLNMRQKSDSDAQFRFASSFDGFNGSGNSRNDSSTNLDQVGGIIPNQINSDGRVHLYA